MAKVKPSPPVVNPLDNLIKLTKANYTEVCGYFLFVMVNLKEHKSAARLRILMDTGDLKATQDFLTLLGPKLSLTELTEVTKLINASPPERKMKTVPVSDWANKLRCKRDLYNILREDVGFVLPKFKNCKRRFLVQLCNGEKKGLPIKKAIPIDPPRYPCFETEALWQEYSRKSELVAYLPDVALGSLPDREFLCTLINSVIIDSIKTVKDKCVKDRIATLGKGAKQLHVLTEVADKVASATSIPTGSIQSSVFKELIPENRAERNVQKYTRLKRKIKANIPVDKRSQRLSRQQKRLQELAAKDKGEEEKEPGLDLRKKQAVREAKAELYNEFVTKLNNAMTDKGAGKDESLTVDAINKILKSVTK